MDRLRRLPPPVTAARLAEDTGVSQRQLYRDIATLRAGGALIDGEAGTGYRLVEDSALPPQSFSRLEIEALRLAVEALPRIGDAELTEAAETALSRIIATLPERQARQIMHSAIRTFAIPTERPAPSVDMALIRRACWEEEELAITYRDMQDRITRREIRPLGMSYSEHRLMLAAWCCTRGDYRIFHCNRILAAEPAGRSFRPHRAALLRGFRNRNRPPAPPP